MTALEPLFAEIESSEFSALLGLASGLSVAKSILIDHTTVQQLIIESRSLDQQTLIYQRLLALLPHNSEPEYAHPDDAAIAAYLYVLNQTPSKFGQLAIEEVLHTPQLWWSRRLAQEFQQSIMSSAE